MSVSRDAGSEVNDRVGRDTTERCHSQSLLAVVRENELKRHQSRQNTNPVTGGDEQNVFAAGTLTCTVIGNADALLPRSAIAYLVP